MGKREQLKKAGTDIVKADKALTHRLAANRDHPAMRAAAVIAELADQPQLITLSLATLGVGLVARRRDLVRGGARMLASHLVATGIKAAIKAAVDRSRPEHALDTGDERLEAGDGSDEHELNSFPSGHTAGAVAVARAASREIDGVAGPATLATAAIAAVQPASGHHYLADVAAGAAIGWAAEAVVDAVFVRLTSPRSR